MFNVLAKDQRVKTRFGEGEIAAKPEFSNASYPCRYKVKLDDGRVITFDRCDLEEVE